MKKQRIIIIGAGPAGLSCAYKLLRSHKKYEVIIIEEENCVGGISKTISYKGNKMDLGGHRFFSKNKEINDLWKSLISYEETVDKKFFKSNENIMLKRKRHSSIFYKKKFFDYPISINFRTIKNLGFYQSISSLLSYVFSFFNKKKENNLENFYINRFGKKLYKIFFENYTKKLWGRHPNEISSEWGTQRIKGISIIKVLKNAFVNMFKLKEGNVETSLIDEFYYPKYGPGQLWEIMAKKIENMGGVIIKSAKVKKVFLKNNTVEKICYEKDNLKLYLTVDKIVSSMPLKDLFNSFDKCNNKIREIAINLPYRDFIILGVLVKKNKSLNKNINNWIYIQEKDIKMGRIQIFNNWSPSLVKNNKDSIWLGLEYFCNEGDYLWNLSEDAFADMAINELVLMNLIKAEDVIDYHQEKVKKAYPAYFGFYDKINDVRKYLNKIENLYCIGRNGQHRYNNMDHSMMTGMIAANMIIEGIEDKQKLWEVNTDKEYLEEKRNNYARKK